MAQSDPMNILLLTSYSPFHELTGPLAAGAEIAMRRIAEHLAARGHNVHFLSFSDKKLRKKRINNVTVHIYNRDEIQNKDGSKISHKAVSWMINSAHKKYCGKYSAASDSFVLDTIQRAKARLGNAFWSYKHIIGKLVATYDIDLIHCFSSLPDSLAATMNANKFGIPAVQRMGGRFWYLKYHSIKEEHRKMRYLADLRYVFNNTASLAFNSKVLKQDTRVHMKELGLHMVHSQPVVDIGVEFPENLSPLPDEIKHVLQPDSCKVLCVGKFKDNSKRQDLLIEAAAILKNRVPIQVVFAGSGVNLDKMQSLAEYLGVSENIEFLGDVPHDVIPTLLNEVDIFAHPTEFEGSSKAVAEAMLAGKPVVGSKIPPLREHVTPYQNGLLAENRAGAFASAIEEVWTQDALRDNLRENALKYAQTNFCPKSGATRYEELFQHIITKSPKYKAKKRREALSIKNNAQVAA